jgi:membrane fusion protein, multidrug efflux system
MKFLQASLQAALLCVIATVSSCSRAPQKPPDPPPPMVSFVTVRSQSVPLTMELPGRTSAYLVAEVRARVDGIVLRREFVEGGDVKENQRLYKIDPAPYQATLNSAKAQLQRARANVESTTAQAERYKILVAGNAVSKQAYIDAVAAEHQAMADVASGEAAVQTASINLGYTDVISPITGRTGISIVTEGAYVQASAATLMTTVQQIDPIYVDLNQTSVEGLQLRQQVASGRLKLVGPDQVKVTLILEDGTKYAHVGTLEFTDITVDRSTGTVTVRALFPNQEHVLLPGMFVRASIDRGVVSDVVLVPQEGVSHDRTGQATVMVVGTDNKVAIQTVDATRTHGTDWVIEGGLKDGDRVIVAGVQKVQAGMLVNPHPAQPEQAAPTPGAAPRTTAN